MEKETPEEENIFFDDIDEDNVNTELQRHLNAIYSYSTHLVKFKYYHLIYKIVKKGYMTMNQICDLTGLKSHRIYTIVNDFEKREMKRRELS